MSVGDATKVELVFGAVANEALYLADEGSADLGADDSIVGHEIAQAYRDAEDPLAIRRVRQDAIHEVGGGLGHASATARGTESASST